MTKILVIGCCGAGKTKFAQTLSSIKGVPAIHLDHLFWLESWRQRNEDDFDALLIKELKKRGLDY